MSAIQFNSAKYDKKHARLLSKNGKKLRALYDAFYQQVAVIGSTIPHADGELYLRDYPAAEQAMYALLQKLSREITRVAEEGNEEAWGISDAKNSRLIASLGLDKATVDSLQGKVTRRSESALKAFQGRKVNGMGLSERVWALHKGVMPQIEMALELGLAQGRSAASLSRDVREYLNEPNKLFRRVRDKDGVLRLSKAAAAYHPGRGVYRSSYKNALRLTATENNMAYRSADHAQWGGMDFVIGVEIGLSSNHPLKDICDELKGVYPKGFKFTGWHPFCRCFATPKLPSREEMNKWARMSDKERAAYEFEGTVKELPKGFNDWMAKNAERIARAKSVPYFIKDNYVGGKVDGGLKWEKVSRSITTFGKAVGTVELTSKEHAFLQNEVHELSKKLNLFNKGFSINISEQIDNGALMSWKGNTLGISNCIYDLGDIQYCPSKSLVSALKKLKNGQTLMMHEEYSIESLFHEHIHSTATFKTSIEKGSLKETIMEGCTQLYARSKYKKILDFYGVEAQNYDMIQTQGFGYKNTCRKLRPLFTKDGKLQTSELINIANETEDGVRIITKKLRNLGMTDKDIDVFTYQLKL